MPEKRKNLLFIFTDEQRLDTLACYGNHQIKMPNLNRFAESACVFESPYCSSPVCTPSRGTLMTGLYPSAHGAVTNNIPLNDSSHCLPELMPSGIRDEYHAGYYGKWHLGDEIYRQHGFDDWLSIEDLYYPHFSDLHNKADRSDYHRFLLDSGFTLGSSTVFSRDMCSRLPEQFGKPKFLADNVCRFIRENTDNLFIMVANFLEPHMPFHGPLNEMYDPAEMPLPENFHSIPGDESPLWHQILTERFKRGGHGGFPLETEDDWRRQIARYWGLNTLVDTHVGRILHTLHETGLDDDTVVVFTSDHGDMMGAHRLLTKGVMYRESVQVPLIVRTPGQNGSGRITGPVSQVDLLPTIFELMGLPIPEGLHGVSLAPLVNEAAEGTTVDSRGAASDCMVTWHGQIDSGQMNMEGGLQKWALDCTGASEEDCLRSMRADVRTYVSQDGFRFTNSPAGEHQLFDLNNDPLETTNLAGDPSYAPLLADYNKRIACWQERVCDNVVLG